MDLAPYTLDELNARIDRAESQIAAGHITSIEDVLREMDEDFELDEQLGSSITEHQEEIHLEAV
jgi:cob(I)alamin adenosyltransferase